MNERNKNWSTQSSFFLLYAFQMQLYELQLQELPLSCYLFSSFKPALTHNCATSLPPEIGLQFIQGLSEAQASSSSSQVTEPFSPDTSERPILQAICGSMCALLPCKVSTQTQRWFVCLPSIGMYDSKHCSGRVYKSFYPVPFSMRATRTLIALL